MLRIENTVERLFQSTGSRSLIGLVKVMQYSREEELVANALKIIRYSIKNEQNHARTIVEYPDLINDVILGVFVNFERSEFINNEMKNILGFYARKKEYAYLIKPDAISVLANHPTRIITSMPMLESISKSYLVK